MSYFLILSLVCLPSDGMLDFPKEADPISWHNLKLVSQNLGVYPYDGSWNNGNFGQELDWVRIRWADLCDCPPTSDAERLPTEKAIDEWIDFAQKRSDWLQIMRIASGEVDQIADSQAKDQLERLQCLYCMKQARKSLDRDGYGWYNVRSALRSLRDYYVGPDNYHLGKWPSHVPMDR